VVRALRRELDPSYGPTCSPSTASTIQVGEAKVQIDTLEVIDSTLGRRQLRFVLACAELHQDELAIIGVARGRVRQGWRSSHRDDRPRR
jgi:hypothetical protein